MKIMPLGTKKLQIFFPTNIFCESKKTKAITLLMFLSLYWSVQNLSLGHQAEEFMPLGKQVEEFMMEFGELFFPFLFPFIFPVRKVSSQCPSALLGGAEWQEQTGTSTHGGLPLWSIWWGCPWWDNPIWWGKQCPWRVISWTDTGEGYWMISCPRWGRSGLCSQFCHAVLWHIFSCVSFPSEIVNEKSSAEPQGWPRAWCLQRSAPLATVAQQEDPRAAEKIQKKWMSSLQQWVTLQKAELSLVTGVYLLVLFHPKGPQPMYLKASLSQRWRAYGRPRIKGRSTELHWPVQSSPGYHFFSWNLALGKFYLTKHDALIPRESCPCRGNECC